MRMRKQLINILDVLRTLKYGDKQKIFCDGIGLTSEISYKLNELLTLYRDEIIELKKSEHANKQLLTSLSHDVRTPLTSLLGYLDALEGNIVIGEEQMQYIKVARAKAYDLNGFVDILFEWFKLDSHEEQFSFEHVDIIEFSKEIIIDWIHLLEQQKNNIDISLDSEIDEWIVSLDKKAFTRIMNNIIQNAIQHGQCNCLNVGIRCENNSIVITISDNGRGIPLEKLPYIFDRLYKCDEARSRFGSGLGLAITKELITAHNGSIKVESVPNVNTIFTITIPS